MKTQAGFFISAADEGASSNCGGKNKIYGASKLSPKESFKRSKGLKPEEGNGGGNVQS